MTHDPSQTTDLTCLSGPVACTPYRPVKHHTSSLERILHYLAVLLLTLSVLAVLIWFDIYLRKDVATRVPIGHFLSMSGPGGLLDRVVIETDQGVYPLWGPTPSIAKGTPLVLESRASGYRFICDEPRSLCIQTTDKAFALSEPSARRSTPSVPSTTSESSSTSQGATP